MPCNGPGTVATLRIEPTARPTPDGQPCHPRATGIDTHRDDKPLSE